MLVVHPTLADHEIDETCAAIGAVLARAKGRPSPYLPGGQAGNLATLTAAALCFNARGRWDRGLAP